MNTSNIITRNDDKQQIFVVTVYGGSHQTEHFRLIIPAQILREDVNQMLPMRHQDGLHKTITEQLN
jgi:hypothetical protein